MKQLCMCEILVTSPAVYSILVMLSESSGGPSGEAGPFYGGALVFLGGAGAPASPSLAPPMLVDIAK